MEGILANARNTDGGKTTAMLVHQALRAKKIYVFGELLALPSVQKLRGSPDFDLLEIFAYGTYRDYLARRAHFEACFGALTNVQESKLRQLTVLTLASTREKHLRYSTVMEECALQGDSAAAERLVISCIYDGLLRASCNPKLQCFVVTYCIARDLRAEHELQAVIQKLDVWLANSSQVVRELDNAVAKFAQAKREEADFHSLVRKEADLVKAEVQRDAGSGGGSNADADKGNKTKPPPPAAFNIVTNLFAGSRRQ